MITFRPLHEYDVMLHVLVADSILCYVQACQEILGVLIGLYVLWLPPQRRAKESGARESTRQQPNVTSLMRNKESQYITVVDKLINTPKISWQASTKRCMQFDQNLSLLRESVARATRARHYLISWYLI